MASTYIKDFRLPAVEGGGFVKLQIVGEGDVHELDVERMREHILKDPENNLPKPKQVYPDDVVLASGKMHAKRTSMGVVTITKP